MSPISSASPSRLPSKSSRTSRPKRTWRSDEAEIASAASSESRRVILQKRTVDFFEEPVEEPIEEPVFVPPPQVELPPPVEWIPEVRAVTPPPIRPETPPPVWEVLPEDALWPNPTREDVAYRDVHAKCGDKPLQLAALARIRAWERGPGAVYSLEEAMDAVRWLEHQLDPPKGDSLHLWEALCKTPRQMRAAIFVGALIVVALLLVSVSGLTAAALQIQRVASIESSGILTATTDAGTKQAAGAAMAVNGHRLLDYPSLPLEELRRAQDVVFQKDGAFHFYRLSSATSVQGGEAVHLLGEDGTVIHVESGHITVTPPFAKEGAIDAAGLSFLERGHSSLDVVGAFRSVVLH